MSEKPVASIRALARYEPDTVYIGTGEYVAECVRADDGDYYLAADVDAAIESLRAEIERLSARLTAAQQPAVDGCHCATCTCNPSMTPAVRFDLSPAQMEGAIRDHLIRLGWTPPDQPTLSQPAARPPKPTECMNGCPDRQVCDHCQWPPGSDQHPAAVDADLAQRIQSLVGGVEVDLEAPLSASPLREQEEGK